LVVWLAISGVLAVLAATLPLRWATGIMVVCVPLSGTAAIMLGDNPIVLPLVVAGGFLARHAVAMLSQPLRQQFLTLASGDLILLGFAAYCVVSGMYFPRLFALQTMVVPQSGPSLPVLLGPWQVSMVQIAYLLLGVYLYLVLRQVMLRRGLEAIVIAIFVQTGLFAGFGLIQAFGGLVGVPVPTDWIVNNEGYALLTQVYLGGFTRVTSVFVEASSYASWATGALAFCYALYINRVLPKTSLWMLVLVGVTMVLSTSSTAYAGLLITGVFATLWAFLDSDRSRHERGFLIVLGGAMVAVGALLLVYSARDGFLVGLREMIEDMTVRKSQSSSGIERGRMADQSITNAFETYFLGVGYGAARSSGLAHQLFGTVGAPGLFLFGLAMAALARRAFRRLRTGEDGVVSASAFALICVLGAMAVSAVDIALPNMMWVFAALAAAPLAQMSAARARAAAYEEDYAGDIGDGKPETTG
jgi:hypothetical protein